MPIEIQDAPFSAPQWRHRWSWFPERAFPLTPVTLADILMMDVHSEFDSPTNFPHNKFVGLFGFPV